MSKTVPCRTVNWLAAFAAIIEAAPGGLAFHLTNPLRVGVAAMRANWAVRPKLALDKRKGGLLVLKVRSVKNRNGHVRSLD